MTAISLTTQSPLLDHFNEFYREVLLIKEDILKRELSEGSFSLEPGLAAARLVHILEQQAASFEKAPQSARQLHEAQYAMAALADEVFLDLDWVGRELWLDNLLEERFFQSQGAGQKIFKRIDTLMARNDSANQDLARVYLMTLALGFRGCFAEDEDVFEIRKYQRNLYGFINKHEPIFENEKARLFPQAYSATLSKGKVSPKSSARRWMWFMVFALAGYLVTAHVLWVDISSGLEAVVEKYLPLMGPDS